VVLLSPNTDQKIIH